MSKAGGALHWLLGSLMGPFEPGERRTLLGRWLLRTLALLPFRHVSDLALCELRRHHSPMLYPVVFNHQCSFDKLPRARVQNPELDSLHWGLFQVLHFAQCDLRCDAFRVFALQGCMACRRF